MPTPPVPHPLITCVGVVGLVYVLKQKGIEENKLNLIKSNESSLGFYSTH